MSNTLLPGAIARMTASSGNAASTDRIPGYDASTGNAVYFTPDQIASGAEAVDGPSSSTDESIARFNGTTGKIIQNTTGLTASDIGAITSTQYIDGTALSTASTSTTMSAIGRSLLSSTAATTFPLAAPGVATGVTKYIRLTSGTTSRKIKISVSAAGTVNEADTNITLSNAGDSVTLISETSTRWGIAGSYVSGVAIATS